MKKSTLSRFVGSLFDRSAPRRVGRRHSKSRLEVLETRTLLSAGALDPTFSVDGLQTTAIGSTEDVAAGVVIQSDGKIIVAGSSHNGSSSDFAVTRYNTDGSLDTTFGNLGTGKVTFPIGGANEEISSVALQSDGKIVVAGYSQISGTFDFAVARLNINGTLDGTFGVGGILTTPIGAAHDFARSVAIQSDNKIVVAGYGNDDFAVVRYNTDGTLDTTFSGDGILTTAIGTSTDDARSVTFQSDGKIVVAGDTYNGSNYDVALVRYDTNGTPDMAFGVGGIRTTAIGTASEFGRSVQIQSDGKIVVAGYSNNGSNDDFALLRYTTDGTLDTTFSGDGKLTTPIGSSGDVATSMVIQSDGRIVVAGYASDIGVASDFALVRYNSNGTLDTSLDGDGIKTQDFGGSSSERAQGVAIQSDGKIVLAGYRTVGAQTTIALARFEGVSEPTNIALSSASILENQPIGTTVGTLSGTDPDLLDTFTYALVSGTGSTDNASFTIDGDTLKSNAVFDYQTKSSYSIRVQTTDPAGKTFAKVFTVTVDVLPTVTTTSFLASGTATAGSTTLTVTFSEAMQNAAVPGNYELQRAGADGLLLSSDTVITPTSVTMNGNTATLTFSAALVEDVYRLTVKDTITDATANPLDGDENGTSGGDWRRDFVVNPQGDVGLDDDFGAGGIVTTELFSATNSSETAEGVVVQPDGKIVAVGSNGVVRYNANGSLDASFGSGGKTVFLGTATSVTLQSDGKIVVAGYSHNGSNNDFALVRYNPDGTLDTSFSDDGKLTTAIGTSDDYARSVTLQSDGKIVVAGYSHNGSNLDFALVRYNPDGTLDTSFSNDGKLTTAIGTSDDYARSVTLQSDGKIVVAGNIWNGSDDDFALVCYNPDGTLDTSFSDDGKLTTAIGTSVDYALSVTLQSDGRIVVAGTSYNGSNYDFALVRYNPDGTLDTSFSNDGKLTTAIGTSHDQAFSVTLQIDGRIVVAGASYNGSNDDFALVRYNPDGTLDTSFSDDGKLTTAIGTSDDYARSVTLQSDGRIVVAGASYNGSNDDFALVRYNPDGTLDTSFDGDGKLTTAIGTSNDVAQSVTLQSDGKIVVAGYSYNGNTVDFALARYNTDGTLDTSFSDDGKLTTAIGTSSDLAQSVTLQSDGKIVVAGASYNGSNNDFALVRYNTDGTLDTTFDGDGKLTTAIGTSDDYARSVTLQSDGKIVVAGYSIIIGGNYDFALVRYNPDGTLDTSFSNDGKLTTAIGTSHDQAFSVTLQIDGRIVVAGASYNGSNDDFALVRYNPDGTLDTSFSDDGKLTTAIGNSTDIASSVTLQSDGKIVVAGYSDDHIDFALVRYNVDGTLDTSFSDDGKLTTAIGTSSDYANSVTLQSDGKIVVAGRSYNGNNYDFALVRYNPDGTLDTSFDGDGKLTTAIGTSNDVAQSVTLQSDGKIVVAGFSDNGNTADFALVRLSFASASASLLSPNGLLFNVDTLQFGTGELLQGTANAFDGLNRLVVDGTNYAPVGSSTTSDAGQTVLTPDAVHDGLTVHREVTVPNTGTEDFARTLDVFTNSTGNAITTTVRIVGNLGSDAATNIFMTSDGDTDLELTDFWFGTDDDNPTGGTPAVIHLLRAPASPQLTSMTVIEDNVEWTYDVTVDAGATTRLAIFTVLGNTRQEAIDAANALVTGTGFGGQAAAFLDAGELASLANFQFNFAPTDIGLSNSTVLENQPAGAVVGTLSSVDPGDTSTFSYALVSGTGDTDNASFDLSGATLSTTSVFDRETKPTYSIRVRTTDQGGLSFDKVLTVTVLNVNEGPTALSLSNAFVSSDALPGTSIGRFTTTDPDSGNSFTWSLVSGLGDTDNAAFQVSNNILLTTAAFDFDTQSSFSIRARTSDQDGLSLESTFTVTLVEGVATVVENLNPGGGINNTNQSSNPSRVLDVSGTLYFSANDGLNGAELWRINSSGVAEMVEDTVAGGGISPGSSSSNPGDLTNVNGTLYFRAFDNVNGAELWRINSSGVAEMVEDTVAGGGISPGSSGSYPFPLTNVNGTLYFRAFDDANGFELWRINSSGVAEMVEDSVAGGGISPGSNNSSPAYLTNVNGTLYFRANNDFNGTELWRINSSGVAEIVEDAVAGGGVKPGFASSYPSSLTNVNGTLYFRANDDFNGTELWRINSSGVAEMVEDSVPGGGINPGGNHSNPYSLTNVNGTLFFIAHDGVNGQELWRINSSGVAEMVEDSVPGGGINPDSCIQVPAI
jgi:uncharacterized delta-60 repeat protein